MDFHTLRMQGLSIHKIAQLRGVSRNRVRRALRSSAPPTGKRRRVRGAALEPFKPQITEWLSDEVKSLWTGERIFDEIEARGYVGGRTVLKEFLREHRRRKMPTAEARFHVKPGQQLQVDWAEVGCVPVGGVSRKVYAFVAIMAWSRALYITFTTDMQLLTWMECHRRAFEFFDGVPSEVLIDNLKTGVISRAGKNIRWQPAYESLAVAHNFRPIAHFPMRPKTKGRVERIVRFVRERFFLGREITDLETFNAEALTWLQTRANTRLHRITRERPCDRFAIERAALQALPVYDVVLEEPRVADAYALVSIDAVRYSIPPQFARRPVVVQRRFETVTILVENAVVAEHRRPAYGVRLVQEKSHLPAKPEPEHERFRSLGTKVIDRVGNLGEHYVALVEKHTPHAPLAILQEALDRLEEFDVPIVAATMASLVEFGVVKRGKLSELCYRTRAVPRIAQRSAFELPQVDVERRSLAVYDEAAA